MVWGNSDIHSISHSTSSASSLVAITNLEHNARGSNHLKREQRRRVALSALVAAKSHFMREAGRTARIAARPASTKEIPHRH
eukprot:2020726-Amphidinium_carterae.1